VGTDCAKHGDASSSKTASIDVNQANAGIVSMMSDSSCSPAARLRLPLFRDVYVHHTPTKNRARFMIEQRNFHDFTPAYICAAGRRCRAVSKLVLRGPKGSQFTNSVIETRAVPLRT
jgi:hypothetical protein